MANVYVVNSIVFVLHLYTYHIEVLFDSKENELHFSYSHVNLYVIHIIEFRALTNICAMVFKKFDQINMHENLFY